MSKTAKTSKWRKFISRWQDLHRQRSKLDYETARLAHEIRSEFSSGAGGDLQFRAWCVRHLEVHGSTALMLLRAVKVYSLFSESDWYDLGGWQSLQFLATLKAKGRAKVLRACHQRVSELRERRGADRHIGYTTVRNICYAQGITQDNKTGRPNRLQVEESLGFCRNWIKSLYMQYEGLPDPPRAVRDALGGTKLSKLTEAASAASA